MNRHNDDALAPVSPMQHSPPESRRLSLQTMGVSPRQRAEISMAVYDILRSNLPPSLGEQTRHAQMTVIARSVEKKLYKAATSPQAYYNFSNLELRIAALATAVLIHTENWRQGICDLREQSADFSQLAAAAKRSLSHCVKVLVSYEKHQLKLKQSSGSSADPMMQHVDVVRDEHQNHRMQLDLIKQHDHQRAMMERLRESCPYPDLNMMHCRGGSASLSNEFDDAAELDNQRQCQVQGRFPQSENGLNPPPEMKMLFCEMTTEITKHEKIESNMRHQGQDQL